MKIYNSLTFTKEEFRPIKSNEVLMYVCGPTVYDSPHLGHAKSAVAFDLVHRYFKFKGYNVKSVKNYTDIDDKIIKRANEKNIDFRELTEHYINEYENIMRILNIKKDFKNPRATEIINFIIEIIQNLISKGHAYESNGSVYFSVKSFPEYKTLLLNISQEDFESEEEEEEDHQVLHDDEKKDRKDFALWKKSKENEPYWESPWGKGRPGWHIECSALAIKYLGDTIDIHGGGQDLKFPHHRNEIAQSEAYTGKKFANYFMHNGFVNVDNEKMSKSLGNFFLVSDVVKEYEPMIIRFFLLSSQYRSSINYSKENLNQAKKNYEKIINTIWRVNNSSSIDVDSKETMALIKKVEETEKQIIDAIDDDFNTPIAIAAIMKLIRDINQVVYEENNTINEKFKDDFFKLISKINKIFGFFPNLKRDLSLGLADSFDARGKLINDLMDIITNIRKQLRKEQFFDINDDLRENLRKFWMKKELDIELAGSFDKRGELIKYLLEFSKDINKKLREKNLSDLENKINEKIDNLGLSEGLTIDNAGSFDDRGKIIEDLLNLFTQLRSKLRENNIYDVSDYICDSLGDFWTQKELDLGIAGSFDKRGELIEMLLDTLFGTRKQLRKRKSYTLSDYIREQLRKLGIKVEDI